MELWHALTALAVLGPAGILALGWRDGWLRVGKSQAGDQHGMPSPRPAFDGRHYVGIAEVARFAAMRRRIGYHAANKIIEALAVRMRTREGIEIGRLGRTSIEFLYSARDSAEAAEAMRALQQALEKPVSVQGIDFKPEIVIGSSRVPGDRLKNGLFDAAAFAVEDARKLPGRISFNEDERGFASADLSGDMLQDLHAAIRADALELHYMPKLRLSDGSVVSAEALCRWSHRDHGSVPPSTFIQLAEESGLIGDLTLWTFDRAIAEQRILLRDGIALAIDVNLSAQLIGNAAFCDLVMTRIRQADGRIGLEITETSVIEHPEVALANLARFVEAGVCIAIDDFGSGLSSLAYLRDLPAHELKIDQSFIRALTTANRDPLLVRSAIEIGHALEMEVTAEGVEDELALALLKVMRCDNVQGYHISMPLPLEQLKPYLRARAQVEIENAAPRDKEGKEKVYRPFNIMRN